MKKSRDPIFSPAGLWTVEWTNFKEYMRDLKEIEAQKQWDKIFNPKRKSKKSS